MPLGGSPVSVWGSESQVLGHLWGQLSQVPKARKHDGVRLWELIGRTGNNTGRRCPCVCLRLKCSGLFES